MSKIESSTLANVALVVLGLYRRDGTEYVQHLGNQSIIEHALDNLPLENAIWLGSARRYL